VLPQQVRAQGTGADHAEAAGFRNGGRQLPARAPDHPSLDDGVTDAEQLGDSRVHELEWFHCKRLASIRQL
jgi:hypothetical protein